MMNRPDFRASITAGAAILLGLVFLGLHGCAGAAMTSAIPIALTSTEVAAVTHAQNNPSEGEKEEDALKCSQLVNHPPGVEELRRTPDLSIESREIRIQPTGGVGGMWVVYRTRGSTPQGWHKQDSLEKLEFKPPLQYLLVDKQPQYLVYAPAVAESIRDSETMMSMADDFPDPVGSFMWKGKRYNYTLSKKLPCFAGPQD
jgi:hypothetical protein